MLQSKIAIVVLSFWALLMPALSSAQESPTVESVIDAMTQDGKASDKSPVPKSSVSPVNLQVHWRLWKKVRLNEKTGEDELTALEHDGRSLGYMNQPAYSLAVTAAALAETDLNDAKILFARAQTLAPNLPYPYLAEAAYVAPKEMGQFPEWGKKLVVGIENGILWPDTVIPWLLKTILFGLFALTAAGLVFIFGQLLRNLPIVAYDATRIMPKGFSSNQTAIILIAAVTVPGVILRSPLISALVMLALVALVQNWREKVVSVLTFAILIALPASNDLVYDLASYFGSATQTIAQAQYVGCDKTCRAELAIARKANPDDEVVHYADLLAAFRTGDRSQLTRITKEADGFTDPIISGYAKNLEGAAWIALAKPKKAAEALADSAIKLPDSPAPRFNLMRAYQMQDKLDDASNALGQAFDAETKLVTQYLAYERRDVNSFMMAQPLPLKTLINHHFDDRPDEVSSAVESVWRGIAGKTITIDQAPFVGAIGILFVLMGIPLRLRRKSSTPCPKCGMARDPHDGSKTGDHQYCLSCYRTFVTGAGMNYEARVHNEQVLGRRELMQKAGRRGLSLLVPGAGHHLAGRAVTGFLLTLSFGFAALIILRPFGVARPPFELFTDNWAIQISLSWIVVSICISIMLYAAVRDIAPVEES